MKLSLPNLATYKNRWYALIFIALGLAIVVIDNTVLNVSIPYLLRDLKATLGEIEWVISGYALTIATLLITIGRLGDLVGRKKIFLIGMVVFATGSFIGSTSANATTLIIGRSVIQASGAAMTLTSALALIVSTFQGKERAIAFGVWGAIAGASATVGPLLGGYLTTFYSWRWSLRINVFVAVIALIGSILIMESKGATERRFDFLGMFLSGAGLFCLVFAFIEGQSYGWLTSTKPFSFLGLVWPFTAISIIPFFFAAALVLLALFIIVEYRLEKKGRSPLLNLSMFKSGAFSIGSAILLILSLGQFGTFFIMPIYLEIVLGLDAFGVGIALLSASISMFAFGIISGFIASRINIGWVIISGMFMLALGTYLLPLFITVSATSLTLAPALIAFGIGFGLSSSQLNNLILSSAPLSLAGEASGESTVMRQVGASIGIAILGAILASTLAVNITRNIQSDGSIPGAYKSAIISDLKHIDVLSGQIGGGVRHLPPQIEAAVKNDVDKAIVDSTKAPLRISLYFTLGAVVLSLLIFLTGSKMRGDTAEIKNRSGGGNK